MRQMSFALTTRQVRAKTKTVTRRIGWKFLRPGDLVQAIEKGQGLKKGEKVNRIAVLRIVDVRRERLDAMTDNTRYGTEECVREGFPSLSPQAFVEMFCATHTVPDDRLGPPGGRYRPPFPCLPHDEVTRIEFDYVAPTATKEA